MFKRRSDEEIQTFRKSINPKVNVIARQELELAYFEATVQHFSYYAPLNKFTIFRILLVTESSGKCIVTCLKMRAWCNWFL